MQFLKKYRNLIIILIIFVLILCVFVLKKYVNNVNTNIQEQNKIVSEEQKDYKYIFYEFGMENCSACDAMRDIVDNAKTIYQDKYLYKYVDVTDDYKVSNKYRVNYTPTYIITDKDGNVIRRKFGMMSENEFLEFMEASLE